MSELAMPKAAKRKGRTRTKRVSLLPPIRLSTLPVHEIDLRQVFRPSLVCVDCRTWVPITGTNSTAPKLVPHHRGTAGKAAAIRCASSNRLVDINIDIQTWHREYTDWLEVEALAVDLTRYRRPTQQSLKIQRPQTRPADRRAQWERRVPAVRTVPAGAISSTRGVSLDGLVTTA